MLAAGLAMRDALAGDLARTEGVHLTVAVHQQEAGHAWPPGVRTVAQPPGEEAEEFLRRLAPAHDLCWVVAPETDGLLLRLHGAVGAARWLGCSAEAIRIAGSKKATCALLHAAGVATPLSFAGVHQGAWIVKPDDGAGTLETRRYAARAAAEADLQRRLRDRRPAVLEPFVEGEPLSISLVVGPELARPVAFNRQHLEVDAAGWLHDLGVQAAALGPADPRIPALRAFAMQVAAALPGLRACVGIDLVWNERTGPVLIEVNPRVTCAYVGLSALLGRNLAAEILAAHGRPLRPAVAGHAGA